MAVTANQKITREDGIMGGGPVITAKTLYQGTMAFVDATTGYLTNIIDGGSNKFAGIVRDLADNASGASGAIDAQLFQEGSFVLVGSGFTQDDVGKKIYATDNYVVTLTSTSMTYIGTITRLLSSTKVLVKIDVQLP